MNRYRFHLYDETAELFGTDTIETSDLIEALEHTKMLIGAPLQPYRVELWLDDVFIGHIARDEGRLILATRGEPLSSHPGLEDEDLPPQRMRAGGGQK